MKPIHIIGAIIISCIAFSCNGKSDGNENKIQFEQTKALYASDSINLEQYEIYNPEHIIASDDSLWITVGEGVLERVYLLDGSGKYKAKGISVGQGPNEVLEITSIHRTPYHITIYDARKGVLSELRYKEGTMQLIPLASQLMLFDDACMLPDSNLLIVPILKNYSYALLDKHGHIADSLDYYPPKPDKSSRFTHSLACTGEMAIAPSQERFARTTVYDGAIDFFSINDDSLTHLLRQEEFGVDYDIINAVQPVPTLSKTTRCGYKSLTVSNDLFYALFSDTLALENESRECKEVQTFTLDGVPCHKYLLDRKITDIAVKPDNSVLYGIGKTNNHEETVVLYIYKLNETTP